jgi:hypothetical protein
LERYALRRGDFEGQIQGTDSRLRVMLGGSMGCPELCPFDRQGLDNAVLSIFELHRGDVYTRAIPPLSLGFTLDYASTSLCHNKLSWTGAGNVC